MPAREHAEMPLEQSKRYLRAVIAVVAAATAGCSSTEGATTTSGSPSPSSAVTATSVAAPAGQPIAPYEVLPNEPVRQAKKAAVELVELLGTSASDAAGVPPVRERLAARSWPTELEQQSLAMRPPGARTVAGAVYPQLGGLTKTETSMIVVVRQLIETPKKHDVTVERAVDVRLTLGPDKVWRPTAIASIGGQPPEEVAKQSEPVKALLDNRNVELSDSAKWDLTAGRVDPRVVDLLNRLSAAHRLSVSTFALGHPINVFGRTVESNHTSGRAVDIWAVDEVPVVSQRESATLQALVDMARTAGATELGAPFDVDGPRGPGFTDTVHQDHLHFGFDPPHPQ